MVPHGLHRQVRSPAMHLRPPSFDHGTVSGMWAIGLGLYVFLGLLAIGISLGTTVVVAVVAIGLIFLYVRLYGEDELRRPPRG
jgi:ABC-type Na+ efflux pump permease subunit